MVTQGLGIFAPILVCVCVEPDQNPVINNGSGPLNKRCYRGPSV